MKITDFVMDSANGTLGEEYEQWLDQLQQENDQVLEELSMREENAQLGDRLRREGLIDNGQMVVHFRWDQYHRLYAEIKTEHGITELVMNDDFQVIRKAKLD